MEVIRASVMGFCFGVHDALTVAQDVREPQQVTIYGQLVHNPQVNASLRAHGFSLCDETGREAVLPDTPQVLITAHGISDAERARLKAAGKKLIDTTCPLVKKAHGAAQRLRKEGRFVVVLGQRDHVEVRGITGDLAPGSFDVVSHEDDVRTWDAPRLGVMCQTTTPPAEADRLLREIERRNPHADVRFVDTVCAPTKQRQEAVLRLLDSVDAVVVVGGAESNNTRRLVELCESHGVGAYRVADAHELRPAWFRGCEAIGLTAGTSTPGYVIDRVHRALLTIDAVPTRALACA